MTVLRKCPSRHGFLDFLNFRGVAAPCPKNTFISLKCVHMHFGLLRRVNLEAWVNHYFTSAIQNIENHKEWTIYLWLALLTFHPQDSMSQNFCQFQSFRVWSFWNDLIFDHFLSLGGELPNYHEGRRCTPHISPENRSMFHRQWSNWSITYFGMMNGLTSLVLDGLLG